MNSITAIDLRNPSTFRGQNLTEAQCIERYTILSELEETLDNQNQALAKGDAKELLELADLVTKIKTTIPEGTHPIHRLIAPHYWVIFPSPESLKIEKYKNVGSRIIEIPKTSAGVVQAVQPGTSNSWFYLAMRSQAESVFRSDFMDALRYAFVANISLIRSSAMLTKEPKIFKEVLSLYKNSTDLYEDQIAFNRSVEKNLISSAQSSHRRLENFHADILQICGPELKHDDKVLIFCKEYQKQEMENSLALYTNLEKHCEIFITKIEKLNTSVTMCINAVSAQQESVVKALSGMNQLIVKRQLLHEEIATKRQQINEEMNLKRKQLIEEMKLLQEQLDAQRALAQEGYKDFKDAKSKEDASRRVETTQQKTEGGFWVFSWEKTVTTQTIHEADFKSGNAYQDYLQRKNKQEELNQNIINRGTDLNREIRERESELNKQLRERETELNNQIINAQNTLTQAMLQNGVLQYGIDKSSMEVAISCLTSASAALTQLEIALNIRRSQAKKQIEVCQTDIEEIEFRNVPQVLRYLEDSLNGIVQKESLWLQSNRQSFTIQRCRSLEQGLQLEVAQALANSANNPDALQQVAQSLASYLPSSQKKPDELFTEKLVDDVELLKLTQGDL